MTEGPMTVSLKPTSQLAGRRVSLLPSRGFREGPESRQFPDLPYLPGGMFQSRVESQCHPLVNWKWY